MSEQQPVPTKYYVRFSSHEDHDKIMAFYRENPHPNVKERNETLMQKLADDGSITLIEDQAGKIVGISISYPLSTQENGEDVHKWTEIGSTRITLNGYPGLFDVMIAMQILRAYLVEPPEEKYVCKMDGAPVRAMAHNLGFRPFIPSQEILDVKARTLMMPSAGTDNWYAGGREVLPVVAQRLLRTIDKPAVENVKNGQKIVLDFTRSNFFAMFEDEIRRVAGKDMGDVENPDASQGIASNRSKWMKRFFK